MKRFDYVGASHQRQRQIVPVFELRVSGIADTLTALFRELDACSAAMGRPGSFGFAKLTSG
jgi:hypothetical protein